MANVSSIRFRGLIAPEEPEPTGDGRMFARNSLRHRRLPAPVMFNMRRTQGHNDSVTVGRLEDIQYLPGRGWMGFGSFLDPSIVPEVVQAIYLVQQGVSRPSVDLQPDLTYEVVPDRIDPQRVVRRILQGTIMGFTFVPFTAFDQVEIEVLEEQDEAILAAAGITFAVNSTSWRRMPVAERETEYDFQSAIQRILEWSGGDASRFRQAFLYQDTESNPGDRQSYHLPIADVSEGRLILIPRAVFSAVAFLSGAHGGLPDIPDNEQAQIREVVNRIYEMLRERFGDPRIEPPWDRERRQEANRRPGASSDSAEPETFGGEMPTINYSVDTDTGTVSTEPDTDTTDAPVEVTFQEDGDGECGNLATAPGARLNEAARRCAADRGWAMSDGSFPIRSGEHGAEDLSNAIRAVGRARPNTEARRSAVRRHIIKRARSLGMTDQIPDSWNSDGSLKEDESSAVEGDVTFQDREEECPEGQVRNDEGECVEREGDDDVTPGYQAASTLARPPKWMFEKPALNRATPLTVDEQGYVYGHLATWNTCHTGIGNQCVTAPKSVTDYAYFRVGEVVCDDGTHQRVGKITLGTGHADPALGFIPTAEHYDNTGAAVAVVNCGEDRFGIWVAGSLVPGVDEEKLAELRRSPLSGDWRRIGGNLELVAALAVNAPGFPVLRASAEDTFETMLAAGVVTEPGEVDMDTDRVKRWKRIEDIDRTGRAKELLGS